MTEPKKKILIFGAGQSGPGWFASLYEQYFNGTHNYEAHISAANVTDPKAVRGAILESSPDIVINAAGKTHGWGYSNIDGCEANEEAKNETYVVNTVAPAIIAACCAEKNIKLVHMASGCIFDGYKDSGWTEEDDPNPVSWYGRTKVWADSLLSKMDNVLILRIRMPINGEPTKRNFITKIASYPKVINMPNSVTVVDDLMVATEKLLEKNASGVFNVANPVPVKHEDILAWYDEIVEPSHKGTYEIINVDQLHEMTITKRSNCTLSMDKLKKLGIELPPAPESIKRCLAQYAENLRKSKNS